MNKEQIDRVIEASVKHMESTSSFFDICRREGCTSFQDVEDWWRDNNITPGPRSLQEWRIAWEMGL